MKKILNSAATRLGQPSMSGIAGVLALAVLSAAAFAQVRQLPQGRVLDSNPQVGTGGSNNPVQGYTPISSNAIIEGNVSGLGRFHGPVGSSSPDVFQGRLGSSTLENFARQSAGGIPTGSGGNTGQVYFLPSSMVSGNQGALYSAPGGSGFDSRYVPANSYSTVGNSKATDVLIGSTPRIYDRTTTAATNTTEPLPGTAGTMLNSPLFLQFQGTALNSPEDAKQTNTGTNPGNNTGTIVKPTDANSPPDTKDPNSQQTGTSQDQTIGGASRVKGRPDDRLATNTGTDQTNDTSHTNLGGQARVSSTYSTLLTELQKAKAEAELKTASAGGTAAPPSGMTPKATGRTRAPHSTLLDQSEATLRSGKEVKPLKSLADMVPGGTPTPFDQQMKNAEALMKDGKFLDAVDVYQQALVMQPENALGMLGRAQAELAAGMYESSATDLKAAYTAKPELIGVRYALSDVVPARRMDDLFTDLKTLSQEDKTANTASFLYCYLAYNTDHPRELEEELGRWGIRPTHDEWQAVAAKAWAK